MLEGVSAMMARIEEIRSHFRSGRAGGVVSVAPHACGEPASTAGDVQPLFPAHLRSSLRERVLGSTESVSAFDSAIKAAAQKYGLEPELLKAVARAESGLNPNAVSAAGAQGLMQLMPSTAAALGVSDPFDPEQSIEGGARYLRQQLDRFGDISLALAAYNAGPGAVLKYGGMPPFRETRDYVRRVLSYRDGNSPRTNSIERR